jgi:hypothetical protein
MSKELLCVFVLYTFPHHCTYLNQILHDGRGHHWGSFRHLNSLPQKIFETLRQQFCSYCLRIFHPNLLRSFAFHKA